MPARQGQRIRDSRGRTLRLGRLLKSGGAGSVFLLEDSGDEVAKLYHPGVDMAVYRRKLEAMLELCPDLPDRVEGGRRHVQIAWPRATAFDRSGRFAGFVMPRLPLEDTSDLEHMLLERQARAAGLPTGLGPRMALAANLATTLAALHRRGHYVVDLKPLNLRFHRRTLHIAMLDCDGFSVLGEGERFPAGQVTPDYLAPEFQRGGVAAGGEDAQDRFALAVIVFQLLNHGIHPYSGRPAAATLPSDLPGRIRENLYAYGRVPDRRIEATPASGHDCMPERLRRLFDRAFVRDPRQRPAATEWGAVLVEYAQRQGGLLVACARSSEHQHFLGEACASCRREGLVEAARTRAKRTPRPARRSAGQPRPRRNPPAPGGGRPSAMAAPAQPVPLSVRTQRLAYATLYALLAPVVLGGVLGWGFGAFRQFESVSAGGGYWSLLPAAVALLVTGGLTVVVSVPGAVPDAEPLAMRGAARALPWFAAVLVALAAAPMLAHVAALPYHFIEWAGGVLGAGDWPDSRMAFRVGVLLGGGASILMLLGLALRELDARYLASAVSTALACMFFAALATPLQKVSAPPARGKPTLVHGEGLKGGGGTPAPPLRPRRAAPLPGSSLGASVDPSSRSMNPPRYPPAAVRAGLTGTVILLIDIDAAGNPTGISVERSSRHNVLDVAAVEAAARWQFNPAVRDGVPVAGRLRVPVDFGFD